MTDDLIARLEKATEADRELDKLLCPFKVVKHPLHENHYVYVVEGRRYGPQFENIPSYTASIDDALKLVPEGWHVSRFETRDPTRKHHGNIAAVMPHQANDEGWANASTRQERPAGATPAIALCIAALKARAALSSTKATSNA